MLHPLFTLLSHQHTFSIYYYSVRFFTKLHR